MHNYERIVGIKNRLNNREYLIKFKDKSYKHCEWVKEEDLLKISGGSQFIQDYQDGAAEKPPYFDQNYIKIEKIIKKISEKEYYIKWCSLPYTEATIEAEVDSESLKKYNKLNLQFLPRADTSLEDRFIIEDPFATDSFHDCLIINDLKRDLMNGEKKIMFDDKFGLRDRNIILKSILNAVSVSQKGPILIATHAENITFYHHELLTSYISDNIHLSSFYGSSESKQIVIKDDFWLEEGVLKFNILLTNTKSIFEYPSVFESINWKVIIVDEDQTYAPLTVHHFDILSRLKYTHSIFISYLISRPSLSALDEILRFTKEKSQYFDKSDVSKFEKIVLGVSKLKKDNRVFSANKFVVNCPLNELQKQCCRKVFYDYNHLIKEGKFTTVSQKLFRIMSHPMILYKDIESDIIEASTKFKVLFNLLDQCLKDNEIILILSQFSTSLDLIEDILVERDIIYKRYSSDSFSEGVFIDHSDFTVILFDTILKADSDLHLTSVNTVIILDESLKKFNELYERNRSGRNQIHYFSNIYLLRCDDMYEHHLIESCDPANYSQVFGTFLNEKNGTICQEIAIKLMLPTDEISVQDLIDESYEETHTGGTLFANINRGNEIDLKFSDFDEDSFWDDFFKTLDVQNIPVYKQTFPDNQPASNLEMYRLYRWLNRVGLSRASYIKKLSGVNRSESFINEICEYLTTESFNKVQDKKRFNIIKQLMKNFSNAQNNDISISNSLSTKIRNESGVTLKRLESLYYLTKVFDKEKEKYTIDDVPSIKCSPYYSTLDSKDLPEVYDKMLLISGWQYGLGVYDHLCETIDEDNLYKVLMVDKVIETYKLDERIYRLCESAKKLQVSDSRVISTFSEVITLDGWSEKDKEALTQYIYRKGLFFDNKGSIDIQRIINEEPLLQNKELSEVTTAVQQILDSINRSDINISIVDKFAYRYKAMVNLKEIFETFEFDDERGIEEFKNLPKAADNEYYFFKELYEKGISELSNISNEDEFRTESSVIKRIKDIIKRLKPDVTKEKKVKPVKEKAPKPPKEPKEKANYQVKRLKALQCQDTANVTFPLMITQSSFVETIGEIVYDREGFHSERYIYPAGYKSKKLFASAKNPNDKAYWISEIVDNGGPKPVFKVYMESDPSICFKADTPSAPWVSVLREISKVKGDSSKRNSISGPEAFLLDRPIIRKLIQEKEEAKLCKKYVFVDFEDADDSTSVKDKKVKEKTNEKVTTHINTRSRKGKVKIKDYYDDDEELNNIKEESYDGSY